MNIDKQQAYLEALLKSLGYSYSIVTDNEGFTKALRSGSYSHYVLLSEKVKLSKTVQKELREAVFGGGGLFVAGGHDNRNRYINTVAGIEYRGLVPYVNTVEMADGNYSYFESPLLDRSHPVRFRADGTTLLAHYNYRFCGSADPALVMNGYGKGKALFAGFDILAEASKDPGGEFETLLSEILQSLQSSEVVWQNGSAVPMTLRVENRGIATPLKIEVTTSDNAVFVDAIDANESNATHLLFREALMQPDTENAYYFWIKALQAESRVEVFADIFSVLDSNATLQAEVNYSVDIAAKRDIDDVVQYAGGIVMDQRRDKRRLQKALRYLRKASVYEQQARYHRALDALLKATDALQKIEENEHIKELRLMIDALIRTIEIELNKAGA